MDPVYILIRTSNRPLFFARMMETIKNQTYNNIVTIVHSDDPRDEYVAGDIIIKGVAFGPAYGDGTYNLYNNRLLKAIPDGPGWFHFIDDDDEYASPDAIEKFVKFSKRDHINVAHVRRWNNTVWPKHWGTQISYQTECFFLHTDHKHKAKWPGNRNGDHYYSKQLTKILPINWIDELTACKAQSGKGNGKKLDKHGKINYKKIKLDKVGVIGLRRHKAGKKKHRVMQGEIKMMDYDKALELEKEGIVKVTHFGAHRKGAPPRQIYTF